MGGATFACILPADGRCFGENSLLDLAANVAEIIAGVAIVVAAIKAWPVFRRMDSLTRKRNKAAVRLDLQNLAEGVRREFGLEPSRLAPSDLVRDILNAMYAQNVLDLHFEYLSAGGSCPGRMSYSITRGAGPERPELATLSHDGYLELIDGLKSLSSSDSPAATFYIEMETHRFFISMAESVFAPVATVRLAPGSVLKIEELAVDTEPWWPELGPRIASALPSMTVVAGRMGSGKSTTAVSLVEYAGRNPRIKLAAAEYPIEFLKGDVLQFSSASPDTYSEAYVAAVGQNPDVLFVGAPVPGEFVWDAYNLRKCTIAVATAPDAASALEDICRQGKGQLKSIDSPLCRHWPGTG